MTNPDLYVLGERDIVTAFRFAGIEGETPRDQASARETFARLVRDSGNGPGAKLLILTEDVSVQLGELLSDHQAESKYPLVVEVPCLSGPVPGKKSLMDSIREAIGLSI